MTLLEKAKKIWAGAEDADRDFLEILFHAHYKWLVKYPLTQESKDFIQWVDNVVVGWNPEEVIITEQESDV